MNIKCEWIKFKIIVKLNYRKIRVFYVVYNGWYDVKV